MKQSSQTLLPLTCTETTIKKSLHLVKAIPRMIANAFSLGISIIQTQNIRNASVAKVHLHKYSKVCGVWCSTSLYISVAGAIAQRGWHPGSGSHAASGIWLLYQRDEVHLSIDQTWRGRTVPGLYGQGFWEGWCICMEPSLVSFYIFFSVRNALGGIQFRRKLLKGCISAIGRTLPLSWWCYPTRKIKQRQHTSP